MQKDAGRIPCSPPRLPLNVRKLRLIVLAFGHLVSDGYLGCVPALLPFFVDKFGISLTLAGALVTISSFGASLSQPLFGYLSDRTPGRVFVCIGPALAGIGICALAFAPTYWAVAVCILIGALGNAFFHPQGAAIAADAVGSRRRGLATSFFSAGGIIGYGTAPIFIVWFVQRYGMARMWSLAGIGLATSILVYIYGGSTAGESGEVAVARLQSGLRQAWRALGILLVVVTLRSGAIVVMNAFTPLLMKQRGLPPTAGAMALFVFICAGGISMMVGGHLSDLFGRQSVTAVMLLCSVPLLFAFLHAHGPMVLVLLALAGATLNGANSVNIVQAQELLPEGAGLASSMTMGLCWGLGSMMNIWVGHIADARGVEFALHIAVILALLAGLAALVPMRRSGQ